jgi:CheY-like chemotaxis protein
MYSDIVSAELRSLRTYAQLLIDDADLGDRAVCATLSDIISSAQTTDLGGLCRVTLFHRLDRKLIETLDAQGEESAVSPLLDGLSLLEKRVLLLAAVCGFDAADIGRITGTGEAETRGVLARVQMAISTATRVGVLIIEDEPHMADLLSLLVQQTGHWVAGIAHTGEQAVELAREKTFGLILSDIELNQDMCGKSTVRNIRTVLGKDVPTVYITAHPDRVGEADTKGRDALLSKPFDIWRVREAVNTALHAFAPRHAV